MRENVPMDFDFEFGDWTMQLKRLVKPLSGSKDWVEYEVGNVTLAEMTPHTHDMEFTPLPPGTIAFRVPDVAEAKAKLEAAGVQVNEMWDSGVCHGAGVRDPSGNAILLHHRYKPYE